MQAAAVAKPLSIAGCPVGVQAMALKAQLRSDFDGTLSRLAAMGYREFELCSFKGFAGDTLRGDFGELADLHPLEIRRMISDCGFDIRSCQFKPAELDKDCASVTLEWAAAIGIKKIVLVDVYFANLDWHRTFDGINRYAEQVRSAGLQLALHSPNDFWTEQNKEPAMHAFCREVSIQNCLLQLDLSAVLLSGTDIETCMACEPGRVFSLHLRDGIKPPQPVPYLPAAPLGQGEIDFHHVLSAAKANGVSSYIVEMIVTPPLDAVDAYNQSAEFIRELES